MASIPSNPNSKLKRAGSLPFGEGIASASTLLSGQKRSVGDAVVLAPNIDIDSPIKRSATYDPTYSKSIDSALRDKELKLVLEEASNVFDCQSSIIRRQLERDIQALGGSDASSSISSSISSSSNNNNNTNSNSISISGINSNASGGSSGFSDPVRIKHMSLARLQRTFEENIQTLVNDNMRIILIDYLAKLANKQDIQLSTYFLAIHLLDTLLCKIHVPKNSFQLVGCVCLQLAAKMDESKTPLIDEIIDWTGMDASVEAFFKMERTILDALGFDLYIPTRYYFAERYSMAAFLSPKEKSMLIYILEFSFRDFSLNSVCMSKVVSAALHYTLQLLRPVKVPLWTDILVHYTGLAESQLVSIINKLRNIHWCVFTSKQAIYQEYDTPSRHYVAYVEVLKESDLRYDFQHNNASSPSSITSFASIDKI